MTGQNTHVERYSSENEHNHTLDFAYEQTEMKATNIPASCVCGETERGQRLHDHRARPELH